MMKRLQYQSKKTEGNRTHAAKIGEYKLPFLNLQDFLSE